MAQTNLNQGIANLCDPIQTSWPLVPSWVGYLGEPPHSGMAASTCDTIGDDCAPHHSGTERSHPRYNTYGLRLDDLREDNVPAHDSVGHDFILNEVSATFYQSRNDTWEDMVADDHEDLVAEWNAHVSKFPADDP